MAEREGQTLASGSPLHKRAVLLGLYFPIFKMRNVHISQVICKDTSEQLGSQRLHAGAMIY